MPPYKSSLGSSQLELLTQHDVKFHQTTVLMGNSFMPHVVTQGAAVTELIAAAATLSFDGHRLVPPQDEEPFLT